MSAVTKRSPASRDLRWGDSRLVQECLKGNESAWSALIDKYKNLIFSIPIKYGFSKEDAADIFQSVCMDLLTDLPRVREPNALGAWLIQVTRNKCFHRRREQLQHSTGEIDESKLLASGDHMESIISQAQREQTLRQILQELSPRCKQLMHLLFFEVPARPYTEVAKELGLAVGSIGLIRRRCLETLRRRLEQAGT